MPDRTAGERPVLNRDEFYTRERYPDREDPSRERDEWRDRADWSAGEGRFYRTPRAAVPDDRDRDWHRERYTSPRETYRNDYFANRDPYRDEYERVPRFGGERDFNRNDWNEPPRRPLFDRNRSYDYDYDRDYRSSMNPSRDESWYGRGSSARDRDDIDHFRGGYRDEDDYWRREREEMRERDRQRRETLDSMRNKREPWRG
jgi:hypothetical protein